MHGEQRGGSPITPLGGNEDDEGHKKTFVSVHIRPTVVALTSRRSLDGVSRRFVVT